MPSPLRQLYRSLRYGKTIVVVSGLPRSGTSMAMKMLEAGGVEILTDGKRAADEDNPKGYYELEQVKNLHTQPDRSWLKEARGKAIKVISYLLRSLPADNSYRVLFMKRDLREILASQAKMLARRGETQEIDDERLMKLFERDLREIRFLLERRPWFETLEIAYQEALDHPREQAGRIAAFLGRDLDIEKMSAVADGSLYRNRLAALVTPDAG
ncbi:MAG: sulfotransferase domain-containing protein [Acidobacteriota bacterium]